MNKQKICYAPLQSPEPVISAAPDHLYPLKVSSVCSPHVCRVPALPSPVWLPSAGSHWTVLIGDHKKISADYKNVHVHGDHHPIEETALETLLSLNTKTAIQCGVSQNLNFFSPTQ